VTTGRVKNVLVVGVSGMIGRNTAKFLRDHGYKVRGVSRGFGEYREASAMEADLADIDLRFGPISNDSFSEEVLDGVDGVVFAAGVSGVAASFVDPAASREGTVTPWLAMLRHARPGTRIVLMSSQLVYGPSNGRPFVEIDDVAPVSPYASNLVLMEHEGSRVAHQRELEVISLRLGHVFGDVLRLDYPRSHGVVPLMLHDLAGKGEIRLFGGGSQTVNLLHVLDLAAAIATVLDQQNFEPLSVFNLNGETLAVSTVAESLRRGANRGTVLSVPWPPGIERAVAGNIELDDSRFRGGFGWRPTCSVVEELERLAASKRPER